MNHDWRIKRLGDICHSDLGKTLNQSKDTGKLYPYLCAVNIQWDKIDLTTLKQTRFEEDETERFSVRKGDLLVCEGGDIGRAAIWNEDEPMRYQNALHRIRFDGSMLPRFCLYYLRFLKNQGVLDSQYGKGVTIKHLVKSSLLSIPIPVPSIKDQQHIVSELDLLTNIIDAKNTQLRDLDALSESIFYEMFGDPIINDYGWPTKRVIDVVKMQRGFDLPVQDRDAHGLVPVYGSNGIIDIHSCSKVNKGVVTGRSGTIGLVYYSESPFWPLNTTLFSTDCHGNNVVYLRYLLTNFHLERFSAGAGVPTLNRNEFHSEQIIDVPLDKQNTFAAKIKAIENQTNAIIQSTDKCRLLLNSRMDYWFN